MIKFEILWSVAQEYPKSANYDRGLFYQTTQGSKMDSSIHLRRIVL